MRLGVLTGMTSTPGRRVGGPQDFQEDWHSSLEKIRIAEELGYEMVVVPESWQLSALPWLAVIALNTSTIHIGTSIVNVFSRSAAALAEEYSTLELISGGRMMLGIGAASSLVAEDMHGVKFEKPLRRVREYTEIFKLLIRGERLHYKGEIFHLDRGFRILYDRPREDVPVWIGALTPKSLRQCGEIADGIMPVHWPTSQMGQLRGYLREGAESVGRDPMEVTIAPHTPIYVFDGQNDEQTLWEAKRPLENYINRMGNFYHEMMTRTGWADEVRAVQAAWENERDRDAAIAGISDRMVREIQVIGTMPEVQDRLRERAENGADLQIVYMPKGTPAEAGKALEEFISA